MNAEERKQIELEIAIAELFIKDLEKLWKSYAKKALEAKQERETKQEKKGFLDYETEDDLIEAYAWGDIDQETYERGISYFEKAKEPPSLSLVEQYRKELKELINRKKGTVKELKEELDPTPKKVEENAFERREREERAERFKYMKEQDTLGG